MTIQSFVGPVKSPMGFPNPRVVMVMTVTYAASATLSLVMRLNPMVPTTITVSNATNPAFRLLGSVTAGGHARSLPARSCRGTP